MNGILQKYGWFNHEYLKVVKLSKDIEEAAPFYTELMRSGVNTVVALKILFKNTQYNCEKPTCILVHDNEAKSSFAFGILTQIILEPRSVRSAEQHKPIVKLLYQCTKSTYLNDLGLYKIDSLANEYKTVNIEDLAVFSPLQLYTANPLSSDRFSAVSLNKMPIIFP